MESPEDSEKHIHPPSPPMFSMLKGAEEWGPDSPLGAVVRWTLFAILLGLIFAYVVAIVLIG